jgi:hypothetical protein
MSRLHELLDHILEDKKITPGEVQIIQDYIREDGRLDLIDVRFLVELFVGSREVCREFNEVFYPALKNVLLKDGRIDLGEQFYLLKMICSDGKAGPANLKFLMELREEAEETTPEFEELCKLARTAHSAKAALGGETVESTSL